MNIKASSGVTVPAICFGDGPEIEKELNNIFIFLLSNFLLTFKAMTLPTTSISLHTA